MKMKRTQLLAFLLPAAIALLQSCDDPRTAKKYNQETTVDIMGLNFIGKFAEAGHTEIQAAHVAENVSKNPRVLDFAKMMIRDHTAAGLKLNNLKNWALVGGEFPVSQQHKLLIDSLSKLSGAAFDKAYMQEMVSSHEQAVGLVREETKNRADHVQDFARNVLPTIEMHLDSAKSILSGLR